LTVFGERLLPIKIINTASCVRRSGGQAICQQSTVK
jgi:hypothetical protein